MGFLEGVPLSITDIGGWGVATLSWAVIVFGFARGKLYAASVVKTIEAQAEKRVTQADARAEALQIALDKSEGARVALTLSTHDLVLESARTLAQTMAGIQDLAARAEGDGR